SGSVESGLVNASCAAILDMLNNNETIETPMTQMPMMNKLSRYEISDDLNRKPAITAPTFPPAPTIPEITPTALLFMKGTTEYVAPLDILRNRANKSIEAMAHGNKFIEEKRIMP